MASKVGDAFVELSMDKKKFTGGLKDARKGLSSFGTRTGATANVVTRGVAKMRTAIGLLKFAIAGILAGGAFAKVSSIFIEQEKQQNKLQAVLKATGFAAGFSRKELEDMASGLQKVTTFGDESILSMQSVLATFKNVKGDNFERATKAILDMATVMDTDFKGASVQLGKALNDPIKGLTALSRVGVSFTAEEEALIKKMMKMNDIAGAQRVILNALETQFGGAASKVRDSFGGAVEATKNSWGDLMEGFGQGLADFLDLEDGFNSLSTKISNAADKIKEFASSGGFIEIRTQLKIMLQDFIDTFTFLPELAGKSIGRTVANVRAAIKGEETKGLGSLVDEMFAKQAEKRKEIMDEATEDLNRLRKRNAEAAEKFVKDEEEKQKAIRATLGISKDFASIIATAQKAAFDGGGAGGGFRAGGGNVPGAVGGGGGAAGGKSGNQLLAEAVKYLGSINEKLPTQVFA